MYVIEMLHIIKFVYICMYIPSLSWLSTAILALGLPKCPGIATRIALAFCVGRPIPTDILAVDPDLALSHAT